SLSTGADQLHDAEVAFLRHDTASCAKLLRDLEESVFNRCEEQDILCKLAQVKHDLCQCLHNGRFDLATAILHVNDVMLHAREAEQVRAVLTINIQGYAVASRRAKRALVIEAVCRGEQ